MFKSQKTFKQIVLTLFYEVFQFMIGDHVFLIAFYQYNSDHTKVNVKTKFLIIYRIFTTLII